MAPLTVSNYLGQLQSDPFDEEAIEGLGEVILSGDESRLGESPLRLMEMARVGHERRSELWAAAQLIEVETLMVEDDPDFRAALLKELGRLWREELLDDDKAIEAYKKCLELRPGDYEVEEAIEQIEQAASNWRVIADRFIEEADGASDATLKTSLLSRAASLVWQYGGEGREEETDLLFGQALEADPGHVRTARLYGVTLRARGRWADLGRVLSSVAMETRSRDEKINCWVEGGRVFAKKLGDKDSAAQCFEQILDFAPTHEEALGFLVEYFTEREQWDHLVALYEDALQSRRKLESEQGILIQLGMVHWRIRNEPEKAEPYFARLRKSEPAHPGMLQFYRELYADDQEGKLLTILSDAQRVVSDGEQKLQLAIELANSAQASNHIEKAIDAWKAVQRLDPKNPDANGALRVLYRRGEKWNALVEVLRAELDKLGAEDTEERLDVLRELVPIYRDELGLDVMVINTYSAILELAPGDEEALRELAATYEQMGRWNDLIKVLTQQAEAETDPKEKVALYMRVAELWISRFANYNQATKPLERVIEIDETNRQALGQLKDIYTKKRAWKSLYGVLKREAELIEDPAEKLERYGELAKLAGDRLHQHGEAIQLWKKILGADPSRDDALDALEKLSEREKDWETLADVLERRSHKPQDERQAIKVLQKLGTVYGEQLRDPSKAAGAWQRVLELDPKNGRALRTLRESFLAAQDWEGLEGLYAEAEDWEGLVDVLGAAAERATDDAVKVELSFRAASVYEEKIGEPHRAFRNYERVLSVDPKDERAARALVPIYEKDEKWPRLVSILGVLFEAAGADDPTTRLELAERIRDLCLERTSDERGAFEWASKTYALAPNDSEVVAKLEAAADAANAHEELIALYLQRIEEVEGSEETMLRRKVASIAGEKLGRRDESIDQLRQILANNPDDQEVIEVLDRLYRAENRTSDLRALYDHRLAQTSDDVRRIELLAEVAQLEEDALGLSEEATERYRSILRLEPLHVEALLALDRLSLAAQRWDELAGVLEKRIEIEDDESTKVELLVRLGQLCWDRRGDVPGAVNGFARVIELDTSNAEAVAGLERIAAEHPDRAVEVGRHLEAAYVRQGAFQKLADVLQERLDASSDEDEKRDLRLRLAELASSELGDPSGAYQSLEAAFLDTPDDATLWDRLSGAAEAAGKYEDLAVAFSTVIEDGDLHAADKAELSRRVAEIYDVVLGEPGRAEPFHKRVLSHDPLADRAFVALKELYTNSERWDDLQALYRNRIAETVDADAKVDLLLQVCFLFEELLEDPDLAIQSYQQVIELDPEHASSLRALDRLYRRASRWRDLVALLQRELTTSEGQESIDLMYELGTLHETKLGEPAAAVDYYEQVLQQNPTHMRSQEALERLIDEPSQRQRIATILEPLYESQGAWQELTRVLEVQLESVGDPPAKVGTLMRIVSIYEDTLHDSDRAFDAAARATAADPADVGVREALARLAQIRDAQKERAEVLEKAIASAEESYLQSELLMEVATLYYEDEQDFERAEAAYSRLISIDADNPAVVLPASQALERIHLEAENHQALAEDLRRQIKFEDDPGIQSTLLVRLGDLLELSLDDVAGAIGAHQQRLDIDPTEQGAMVALERLYDQQGEWQKLIGILQTRDGVTIDEAEQREIARRIGDIYEQKLGDIENAVVAYNEVLSRFGPDRDTLEALKRLYRAGAKWDDLLEIVEMSFEAEADPSQRAELRFQAAELMRTKTGAIEPAIDYYNAVLEEIPGHAGAIHALEEVLTDPDGYARVAAARSLVDHYRAESKFAELVSALEVLAETDDPYEKLQSLKQAAEVADVGLEDQELAFRIMGRAVTAGASEVDLESMLNELQRLAQSSGKWAEYVATLQSVAPDIMDPEVQTQVLMEIARTARARLSDVDLSRRYYDRVLENRPDFMPALNALEELDEEAEDWPALLEVVRRKTEMCQVPAERVELLMRQAVISEERLSDVTGAIDSLEQVLMEGERPEAYEALERLYRRAERYSDLAAMYDRMLDNQIGEPVEIRYRLGRVYLDNLNDSFMAIEQLREGLRLNNGHDPSIEALEELMRTDEHRAAAAEILEPVFLGRMDWAKVAAALDARLSVETDVEVRKELLRRVGQLHEDYLEDLEGALEAYARLFREDPLDQEVWDTLSRLAKVLDLWDRQAEIYAAVLEDIIFDDDITARLCAITGRLFDEKVNAPAKAARFYARALKFDPTDRSIFEALEVCYRRIDEWDALLDLYRERGDMAESDEERVGLLHKVAKVQEEQMGSVADAIDAYRRVLEVDPADQPAIEELDRLFTQTEQWVELTDHLRFRIDGTADVDQQCAIKHRLGELLRQKLDDVEGAIDIFEEIVQVDPSHRETVAVLEQLVLEPHLQGRITQILEPLYREADEWKKLVAVLEAEAQLEQDPIEQARILSEIARLHEARGENAQMAFEAYSRAFVKEPASEEIRAELDRLAAELGNWDALVATYEQALGAADDPMAKSEILSTVARTHDERRGDPRAAIETYERLLEHDPDDPLPLESLEALHTMVGDWRGLVDVLARKTERAFDPMERADLLRRSGSVLEELLQDPQAAIEVYRRATEEDADDPIALEALDRLYSNAEAHHDLAEILRRRVAVEADPDLQVELGLRLAKLCDSKLGQPHEAIDALQNVLLVEPGHEEAMQELARLYEAQAMWPELLDILRAQADGAETDEARVAAFHRAGAVLEEQLDDPLEAISMYQQALGLNSRHEASIASLKGIARKEDYREPAIELLEPLFEVQERWDDLAEVLALKAQAATDPFDKRDRLRALARVHETGRGDASAAFDALREALAEDPADTETVSEVERLAAELDKWGALADTLAARASSAMDPQVARVLYVRLARVAKEQLEDDLRAIEAYNRALEQVGDDPELLLALDDLYVENEQWEELGGILRRRVDQTMDAAERNELLVRLGELRRDHFRDERGAFAAFQEVLEAEPTDSRALGALEVLARESDLAHEVVDTLDDAYRQTGDTAKVAGLYDIRIRIADSDGERVRLLQEVAGIWENELAEPAKALEALRQAFELDPRDQMLLEDVERLAEQSQAWETLRGMVERVVERDDVDRMLARELNMKAAAWYRDHLGEAEAACSRLAAAIEAEPEALDAHAQLVDLLRAADDPARLVSALRAWAEVEMDESARKDRLTEAAELSETALALTEQAAECYEAILKSDPSDSYALGELSRIRTDQERWPEVADLISRQIEVEMLPEKRLELRTRLAELYAGPLAEPEKAIEALVGILDEDPTHLPAIDSLERLYEQAERWDDLRDLLDRRLEIAETDADRIAARVRLARLQEQAFGRRGEAMEQLREILEMDPANAEALGELERLLRAEERWDELVELLERRLADASDDEAALAFLGRIAEAHREHRGDFAKAVEAHERILERVPGREESLRALVELGEARGDAEGTASAIERLLEVLEGSEAIEAAHRLAQVAEDQLNDMDRAEAALSRAHQMDPTHVETREKLKKHLEKHGKHQALAGMMALEEEELEEPQEKVELLKKIADLYVDELGDPGTAATYLEKASELVPEDREVLLPLCDLYIDAGRQEDAVPVLQKIIESYGTRRSKELANYHHRLGRALEGMGDSDKALEHYDAAFKIDLTNVAILRDLGKLTHSTGDFDRAQKTFRALLLQKLNDKSGITKADVYFYLGDISAKQGDKNKAISMLERAVAEDKEHPDASALLSELKG